MCVGACQEKPKKDEQKRNRNWTLDQQNKRTTSILQVSHRICILEQCIYKIHIMKIQRGILKTSNCIFMSLIINIICASNLSNIITKLVL